jgi:hypothetical protein
MEPPLNQPPKRAKTVKPQTKLLADPELPPAPTLSEAKPNERVLEELEVKAARVPSQSEPEPPTPEEVRAAETVFDLEKALRDHERQNHDLLTMLDLLS